MTDQDWTPPPGWGNPGQPSSTKKPWHKRKRVLVPAGALAALIAIGAAGGGQSTAPSDSAAAAASVTPSANPSPPALEGLVATPTDQTAAARGAAAQAAKKKADEAAAKRAAADAAARKAAATRAATLIAQRVAAQQNTARAAAAKAAAQAAAEQAATEQASQGSAEGPTSGLVHPGAFCSPDGATGVMAAGTAMFCGPTAKSPDRSRWHKA